MKYHENLLGKPAAHRDRYDENAAMMGCFQPDSTGGGLPGVVVEHRFLASWSLEDVVDRLLTNGAGTWAQRVFDRYCDFSKIERALATGTEGAERPFRSS